MADWNDDPCQDTDKVPPAEATILDVSAPSLNDALVNLDAAERLAFVGRNVFGLMVFTTSFGLEDQALTHLIVEAGIECQWTGRVGHGDHASGRTVAPR